MQFQRLFTIGERIARLLAECGQVAFLRCLLDQSTGVERAKNVAEQHNGALMCFFKECLYEMQNKIML